MLHDCLTISLFSIDSCPSGNTSIAGENISWNEAQILQLVSLPCPCRNLTLQYHTMITRRCGGSYSHGAVWEEVDSSNCGFTNSTLRLCEALNVGA